MPTPPTRAAVEAVLIGGVAGDSGRVGGFWSVCGFDATTVDGTNRSLNDPITQAARDLSYPLADFTQLADQDLVSFGPYDFGALCDVATLYCLRKIEQNYTKVDETVGPRSQRLSQRRDAFAEALKYWAELCQDRYGIGLMPMSTVVATPVRGYPTPQRPEFWGPFPAPGGTARTDH